MKTVAFITIRLNSKRLENKNILPLGEHPLSWYVCETLLRCNNIDEIYIYCSDETIMQYVPINSKLKYLKRDKWLDGDTIRAQDTYTAFINDIDADIYVAGLTTAPFITSASIEAGVDAVKSGEFDSAFAAKRIQTFAWYEQKPINYDPALIPRTQDLKPVYYETSGFFVFTKDLWIGHKRRIGFNPLIVEVNDIEAIDIDTKDDYNFAKLILEATQKKGEVY